MNIWYRKYGTWNASMHTLAILDQVERDLLRLNNPRQFVSAIRIGAGQHDNYDYEVEIELAPGTMLSVRYQSVDEEGRDADAVEEEGDAGAWQVVHAVEDFAAFGVDALAEMVHDLRVRTRKILAEWSLEGTHATLMDIRLVHTEHWCERDGATVELRLTWLDDKLRPTVFQIDIDDPDRLEADLGAVRAILDARFAMRAWLARHGADAMVDKLVLNAIAWRSDPADEVLRGILAGKVYWLTEQLTVYMSDGVVQCHGRHAGTNFSWGTSCIRLQGQIISADVAAALRGQPITSLFEHPMLSNDMIISGVTSNCEYGGNSVQADFEQPRLVFCSASGRIWAPRREMVS